MKRSAFIVAAASLTLPNAARAASGTWSTLSPMPIGAIDAAVASLDDRIHVVGGFSAQGQQNHQVYDPVRDEWSLRAPLPRGVNGAAAASAGGLLFVFGGLAQTGGPRPGYPLGTVFAYDPVKDAWSIRSLMPTWRGGLAAVVFRDRIHTIGGRVQRGSVNVHEAYDPKDDSWERLEPLPKVRDHLALAATSTELHAFGGRLFSYGIALADHDAYSRFSQSWSERAPLLTPRSGHAAVTLQGQLWVLGGVNPDGVLNSLEVYDPASDRWAIMAAMLHGRHDLGAVALRGQVIACGGSMVAGIAAPSGLNEAFSPP